MKTRAQIADAVLVALDARSSYVAPNAVIEVFEARDIVMEVLDVMGLVASESSLERGSGAVTVSGSLERPLSDRGPSRAGPCTSCGHDSFDHDPEGCHKVTWFGRCYCTRTPDSAPPPALVATAKPCQRGMTVFTCQGLHRCEHGTDPNHEWCWVVDREARR